MLIAIDLQNDYFDSAGRFFIPKAPVIVSRLVQRLKRARADGELIAYTMNRYPEAEYDLRSAREIAWAEEIYPPFQELLAEATCFAKEHYGIPPEEALRFKEKYADHQEYFNQIEFIGVETSVCVLANMTIIQNIFPTSRLLIASALTADQDDDQKALAFKVMRGLNMIVKED